MEDSAYNSLSSIPAKVLNYSSRIFLSNNLDNKQVLTSKSGCARDYRGLAELMAFEFNMIRMFERGKESPTQQILEAWATKPNATFGKLIEFLEEMERHDIITDLIPLLEKSAKTYLENQKLQEIPIQDPEVSSCPPSMHPERELLVFTRDDLQTGECTYYDAYVSYADEDCHFVRELARVLESPDYALKLFIRERDLLAGYAEHDINIMLIKERCRRMLIILSPNFLNSPACEFQISFAAGLAIDQRLRMLIPIVYSSCEIPLILKYVSKIDFTKPGVQDWVWDKLISSLLPEDSVGMFTSTTLDKIVPKRSVMPRPRPASLTSATANPMITYPPTTRQFPCAIENSSISVSSATCNASISEYVLNNSTVPVKTSNSPKKWKFPRYLKEKFSGGYSASHSISSSSSATSGFHSQSGDTFENLESSEDCTSGSPV